MEGDPDEWREHRARLEAVAARCEPYPRERFAGRGVVICGGGWKYLPGAYVCVRMLRELGCGLPVELWHLGGKEMPGCFASAFGGLGVEMVDAMRVAREHPCRLLRGWELKCYSVLHCRFREVLLLDADNVPAADPQSLFDGAEYREHGAVFWPDLTEMGAEHPAWRLCGLEGRREREIESGQVLVDKARCWDGLRIAMHLNEWSDFYYQYVHGDKETFHLGWRKAGLGYALAPPVRVVGGCMFQHDFEGRVVFQHRNGCKWRLLGGNRRVRGFAGHERCEAYSGDLLGRLREAGGGLAREFGRAGPWLLARVGRPSARVEFLAGGEVISGGTEALRWRVEGEEIILEQEGGPAYRLKRAGDGLYVGHAAGDGRSPVVMKAD